jgi:hypothetical protein
VGLFKLEGIEVIGDGIITRVFKIYGKVSLLTAINPRSVWARNWMRPRGSREVYTEGYSRK